MKKKGAGVGLILHSGLVGLGLVVALFASGCDSTPEETVLRGNIDDRELQLCFVTSERVASVRPEEGALVKQGELIATLETDRIDHDIKVAQAALEVKKALLLAAEARMLKSDRGSREEDIAQARDEASALEAKIVAARNEMLRKRDLVAKKAVSQQDVDDAEAKFKALEKEYGSATNRVVRLEAGDRPEERSEIHAQLLEAKASVAQAAAQLAAAEQKRKDAFLYAPREGIIRERLLEPGEYTSPLQPVVLLAATNPRWVRCYLRETQLTKHHLNDKALIQADGLASPLEGWIGYISPTAEFTPKNIETDELRPTLVYEIRVYVKDPDHHLKLGMPVVVTLP